MFFTVAGSEASVPAVIIYLTANGTSHPHTAFLTWAEANALMMGLVASVTKQASMYGTHVHSVTITWDATNRTFQGSSTVNAGHTHGDIVCAPQSTYGSYYQSAESLTESTSTTTAFATKVTLTTPSLPLGNYFVAWTFGISNSNGKEVSAEFRRNATRIRLIYFANNHQASAGQYTSQSGFNVYTGISGVQTFDIRYANPGGNTTRIGDATIVFYKVL